MNRRALIALVGDRRGTAAAEMALIAPLLLILGFGSIETGNFFLDQHTLEKAVRDGARFAARQSFSSYPTCSGSPDTTSVVTPTQNVVMYGYLNGTNALTPNIIASDITVSTQCFTSAVGGQTMSGLYKNRTNGAQVVTVTAAVPYRTVVSSFGIRASAWQLNATSQAAVTGI